MVLLPEMELLEGVDLTETMRGANRVTAVAGIGCVDASSMKISELTESRIRDGEIDAIV